MRALRPPLMENINQAPTHLSYAMRPVIEPFSPASPDNRPKLSLGSVFLQDHQGSHDDLGQVANNGALSGSHLGHILSPSMKSFNQPKSFPAPPRPTRTLSIDVPDYRDQFYSWGKQFARTLPTTSVREWSHKIQSFLSTKLTSVGSKTTQTHDQQPGQSQAQSSQPGLSTTLSTTLTSGGSKTNQTHDQQPGHSQAQTSQPDLLSNTETNRLKSDPVKLSPVDYTVAENKTPKLMGKAQGASPINASAKYALDGMIDTMTTTTEMRVFFRNLVIGMNRIATPEAMGLVSRGVYRFVQHAANADSVNLLYLGRAIALDTLNNAAINTATRQAIVKGFVQGLYRHSPEHAATIISDITSVILSNTTRSDHVKSTLINTMAKFSYKHNKNQLPLLLMTYAKDTLQPLVKQSNTGLLSVDRLLLSDYSRTIVNRVSVMIQQPNMGKLVPKLMSQALQFLSVVSKLVSQSPERIIKQLLSDLARLAAVGQSDRVFASSLGALMLKYQAQVAVLNKVSPKDEVLARLSGDYWSSLEWEEKEKKKKVLYYEKWHTILSTIDRYKVAERAKQLANHWKYNQ